MSVHDISFPWKDWDGGNSAGDIHSGLNFCSQKNKARYSLFSVFCLNCVMQFFSAAFSKRHCRSSICCILLHFVTVYYMNAFCSIFLFVKPDPNTQKVQHYFTLVFYFKGEAGLRAESPSSRETVHRVKTCFLWDLGQRVWSAGRGVLQTTARDRDEKLGAEGVYSVKDQMWLIMIKSCVLMQNNNVAFTRIIKFMLGGLNIDSPKNLWYWWILFLSFIFINSVFFQYPSLLSIFCLCINLPFKLKQLYTKLTVKVMMKWLRGFSKHYKHDLQTIHQCYRDEKQAAKHNLAAWFLLLKWALSASIDAIFSIPHSVAVFLHLAFKSE